MPYNTRRVSLSLPSLGIHLPGNSASRAAQKSASTPNARSASPPTKRVKRSHTTTSAISLSPSSSTPVSPSRQRNPPTGADRHKPAGPAAEATPPPSPGRKQGSKLDTEGIDDDIVVAVIQQLENTGNRPHLIKELAAALLNRLAVVESSANPVAIISSRLTNYLRRPWTAIAPCPLAKEQVATHPRRVYYYLTTTPRQEIPEFVDASKIKDRTRVTPASSSTEEDETPELGDQLTFARSPSPDFDLASPELEINGIGGLPDLSFHESEDSHTHDHPFPDYHNPAEPSNYIGISYSRRGASPPLETDEREFSETANVMQQRRESEQAEQELQRQKLGVLRATTEPASLPSLSASTSASASPELSLHDLAGADYTGEMGFASDLMDDSEEAANERAREAAATLFFGGSTHHLYEPSSLQGFGFSSPMLAPQQDLSVGIGAKPGVTPRKKWQARKTDGFVTTDDMIVDSVGPWAELKSPEHVGLAELDDLLGNF